VTRRLRRNTRRARARPRSAITKGEHVLVLGTVSSTTIKAHKSSCKPLAADLSPPRRQRWSPSKRVRPKRQNRSVRSPPVTARVRDDRQWNNRQQGDGSRVGGLPGGIVDRVVKLSNGEYEVHTIGSTGHTTSLSTRTSSGRRRLAAQWTTQHGARIVHDGLTKAGHSTDAENGCPVVLQDGALPATGHCIPWVISGRRPLALSRQPGGVQGESKPEPTRISHVCRSRVSLACVECGVL